MLMENFYRLWITTPGMTKSEALRQAQLALLHGSDCKSGCGPQQKKDSTQTSRGFAKEGGAPGVEASPSKANDAAPYSNPYYWAPFVLMGNWK